MSRKTARKHRQKQQKQASQSSESSQPQPQEQQQQQEPQASSWRRSPSFIKTLETIDEGTQTNFRPPEPPQEPQEEEEDSRALKTAAILLLLVVYVGLVIGYALKWLAPQVIGAMHLALRVFVAEEVRLVIGLPFEVVLVLLHILTGKWGFLECTIVLVLVSLLTGYFGTRYLLRQE